MDTTGLWLQPSYDNACYLEVFHSFSLHGRNKMSPTFRPIPFILSGFFAKSVSPVGTAGFGFFAKYDPFYAEQSFCSYGFFAKCDPFYAEQGFLF